MLLAHVVPELELVQVLRQMLSGNVNMRAANAALDLRPEAFNGIHTGIATNVFFTTVVDRAMHVAFFRRPLVNRMLVGADPRAFDDVLRTCGQTLARSVR